MSVCATISRRAWRVFSLLRGCCVVSLGKRTEIAYQGSGTVPIFAEALRSENGTVPFTPAGGMSQNWVYLFCPLALGLAATLAWAEPPALDDPAPAPPPELRVEEEHTVVEPVSFESYQPPIQDHDFAAVAKAVEPITLENGQAPPDLHGANRAARVYRVVRVKSATAADAPSDQPVAEGIEVLSPQKLARAYKIAAVLDASDSVDPTKYGLPKETKVAKVQLVPMGHRIVEVKEVSAAQEENGEPNTAAPAEELAADEDAETSDPFTDDEEAPNASPLSIAAMGFSPIGKVTVDTSIKRAPGVEDEALQLPKDEAVLLFLAHGEERDVPRVGDVGLDEWFFLEPASFCNQPLYFEEVNLERFGTSRRPRLQSVVSGARFFATVPALPYLMAAERPRGCYYETGPYRAGRPAPRHNERPPLRLGAVTVEGAVITALIFLVP